MNNRTKFGTLLQGEATKLSGAPVLAAGSHSRFQWAFSPGHRNVALSISWGVL